MDPYARFLEELKEEIRRDVIEPARDEIANLRDESFPLFLTQEQMFEFTGIKKEVFIREFKHGHGLPTVKYGNTVKYPRDQVREWAKNYK
ncbi:MAG: hypothetical protein LBV67_08045 [Streptococcaceae bacterium]|nr:hypothetical protein [Streptococcaceae bacterium]